MGNAEALAAGKALVEALKVAQDLVTNPDGPPHRVRATAQQMMIHLTSAHTGLAEVQQELMELRSKLNEKEAQKVLADDVEFVTDGGFYVRKSEVARGANISYCPLCWTKDDRLVPLQVSNGPGSFRCSVHQEVYETEAYLEAKRNRSTSAQRRPRSGRF